MKKPAKGELPPVLEEFAAQYPEVWEAYNGLGEATAAAGPLEEKTQRLLKLAIAIGAQRQGAVNSHTRRALAAGCTPEEIVHVGILAIPSIGWSSAFAAICWIRETLAKHRRPFQGPACMCLMPPARLSAAYLPSSRSLRCATSDCRLRQRRQPCFCYR